MSADSRGIVPQARNSILPGPLSALAADAHLPKWEPLSGEGGGAERGGGRTRRERGGGSAWAAPFSRSLSPNLQHHWADGGREVPTLKRKCSITCLINTAGFGGSKIGFHKPGSWQTHFSGDNYEKLLWVPCSFTAGSGS